MADEQEKKPVTLDDLNQGLKKLSHDLNNLRTVLSALLDAVDDVRRVLESRLPPPS